MKAILQLKEAINIGGQYYDKIAGDFNVDEASGLVSVNVGFLGNATLLLRLDDVFCSLIFPDDADLSMMDPSALYIS